METNEDVDKYISGSKLNIDNFIRKNEYRKAFGLLILFLERLDGKEKADVIDYYSKNIQQFGILTMLLGVDNKLFINKKNTKLLKPIFI